LLYRIMGFMALSLYTASRVGEQDLLGSMDSLPYHKGFVKLFQ
jgi:hypothetical protein